MWGCWACVNTLCRPFVYASGSSFPHEELSLSQPGTCHGDSDLLMPLPRWAPSLVPYLNTAHIKTHVLVALSIPMR